MLRFANNCSAFDGAFQIQHRFQERSGTPSYVKRDQVQVHKHDLKLLSYDFQMVLGL